MIDQSASRTECEASYGMPSVRALAVLVVALCILTPGAGAAPGKPGKASGQSPVQAALAAPCKLINCAALSKGMEKGIKVAKAAMDKLIKDVKQLADTAVAFLVKIKDDVTGETAKKEKAQQARREAIVRAVSDEGKSFEGAPHHANPPPIEACRSHAASLVGVVLPLHKRSILACSSGGLPRPFVPTIFERDTCPFDQRKVARNADGSKLQAAAEAKRKAEEIAKAQVAVPAQNHARHLPSATAHASLLLLILSTTGFACFLQPRPAPKSDTFPNDDTASRQGCSRCGGPKG